MGAVKEEAGIPLKRHRPFLNGPAQLVPVTFSRGEQQLARRRCLAASQPFISRRIQDIFVYRPRFSERMAIASFPRSATPKRNNTRGPGESDGDHRATTQGATPASLA